MELKDLKTTGSEDLKICSCCHRLLPLACFPLNGPTGRRDSRCRDCHRLRMRLRRLARAEEEAAARRRTDTPRTPLITATPDRTARLQLILRALRTVHDRMDRLRRRRHLREFCHETGWNAGLLYGEPEGEAHENTRTQR